MRSSTLSLAWITALTSSALAQQPPKALVQAELLALEAQYQNERAQGADETALVPLLERRTRLVARLGGGDPGLSARANPSSAMLFASAPTSNAVLHSISPPPPGVGVSTSSHTLSPNVAIPDAGVVQSSQTLSGLGSTLWDVDLYVDISHTWSGDLELFLIAPSGKRVTIVTDVAEGAVDVFRGTTFDDSPNAPAWAHPFVSGFTATPLNPEGALHWLAGEDPNGQWKLEVRDDAFDDVGVLHSWRLDITTLNSAPPAPSALTPYTRIAALPIPDFTPTSSSLNVAGLFGTLAEVRVRVNISHNWSSDLRFELVGPSGRRARLSTFNGGSLDNVFAGTNFFDVMGRLAPTPNPLLDQPIDGYPFFNNVAAVQGQPEGSLSSFLGDAPNGTWTLEIVDAIGGFTGTLNSWELSLSTYAPAPAPYCMPLGPNADGCLPAISATSNPNVAHSNSCVITIQSIPGQRNGILYYGIAGPVLKNWCLGGVGNSRMCVESPTQRTGAQFSGGTMGACDGTLGLDWNAYQLGHPGSPGSPWMAGATAQVQGWFRSPADCRTTFLTQAIELTYLP